MASSNFVKELEIPEKLPLYCLQCGVRGMFGANNTYFLASKKKKIVNSLDSFIELKTNLLR